MLVCLGLGSLAVLQNTQLLCKRMCMCEYVICVRVHILLNMHACGCTMQNQTFETNLERDEVKSMWTLFLKPFLLLKYSLPNRDIAQTQEARSSIPTPPQYLKRCVTQLVVSFLCSLNIAAFSCFFVPYCLPTFLLSASSVSSQEHCRLGGTHCGYLWPPKIGTAVL